MTRSALFAALLTGVVGTASRADVEVAPPPRPKGVPFTPPPRAKAEDPAETVGKIIQNAKDVTDRLSRSDTSTTTRKTQDDTLALIDMLINRQDDPPPSGDDNKDKNDKNDKKEKGDGKDKKDGKDGKGGMNGVPQPKGGTGEKEQGKSGGRRPRSEAGKEQAGKQPGGKGGNEQKNDAKEPGGKDPMGGTAGMNPGNSTSGAPPKASLPVDDDVAKDVWGHLPDKLRQQVTAYYKEEFMPRYADLLKQYYSSLSSKSGEPKK